MLKVLWLVALFSLSSRLSFGFVTADYKIGEPKGWHSVTQYGGADVGFLKAENTKDLQVILLATSPYAITLDKDFSYLKNEMKKMAVDHTDLKIEKYSSLSGSVDNAYVKYSFLQQGFLKHETLVAVPHQKKTHFIMLSSDGADTEGAERALVAMVHSLKLM